MEQIKHPKFLYRGIWRTGRICRFCGLWEYSKDTREEFDKWLDEPKCRVAEEGYCFGFGPCGDFMYMPISWWSEE